MIFNANIFLVVKMLTLCVDDVSQCSQLHNSGSKTTQKRANFLP